MWRFPVPECLLLVLLVACAPAPRAPQVAAPEAFPAAFYGQAARQGKAVYRVDPQASRVEVEVGRGGRLARLGHDHLVTGPVHGFVLLGERPRADLYLNLFDLEVRGGDGLSPQALAATRRNMLKSLEAVRHPWVIVHAEGQPPSIALTLHGITRPVESHPSVERSGGKLLITGDMAILQSDFGITPFSILGGALRVKDRLVIRYRLTASPLLK